MDQAGSTGDKNNEAEYTAYTRPKVRRLENAPRYEAEHGGEHKIGNADRLEKEVIPALKAGFIVLSDRYIFTALARAGVRGVDRQWIRNLFGFAIAPHLVFYLRIDEKTLIRRVLQARGMDYWESGMDMKLGDDIYESFRAYQRQLLKEYASMGDEFNFRVLDARRKVDVIQDELRRQIAAFLAESVAPAPLGTRPD